jgi:hypothetical protein
MRLIKKIPIFTQNLKTKKMANTYTWRINAVDCYTSKEGLEKVAYNVHWSYFATDGEHTASMIGVQSVGEPDLENFVAFEELTEEQVVEWITASIDVEKMQESLDTQIANLVAPKVVTLQLTRPVVEVVEEEVVEEQPEA